MRRPSSLTDDQMWLRAGIPVAIVAQIRSGLRIVGTVPLDAIGDIITALGRGRDGSTVIIVLIVVVGRSGRIAIIIAGPAIITLRSDGAADYGTGHRAGNEAAAATHLCGRTAATAAAKTRPRRAAAGTKPRSRSAAADMDTRTALAEAAANDVLRSAATCADASARLTPIGHLGEACGRRHHWQNQRHCRSGTQNFKTDHCRLHTRDTVQPVRSADVPEPRTDCARHEAVRSELYAE